MAGVADTDHLTDADLPQPTRVEITHSKFDADVVYLNFFVGEKQYTGFWASTDGEPMEPRLAKCLIGEIEKLHEANLKLRTILAQAVQGGLIPYHPEVTE